jgi:hypothetical protein
MLLFYHAQSGHPDPTEISGGLLPNGLPVDLIRDGSTGELKLAVLSGSSIDAASSIRFESREFIPVAVDPRLQCALTLPTHASSHGSTETLFDATHGVFTRHGMSPEVADAAVYFVFCTWFPERCSPAPCLVITGPSPEAALLLQILGCVVRRGLPMVQIGSNGFCEVAERLRPTLLVDGRRLSRGSLRLLSSCGPRAYIPWKESVADFGLAKAIYVGAIPIAEFSPDFSLEVHLSPSRASVRVLDEKTRAQITADFQPKFLDYRLRKFAAVRDSTFDLPGLDSEGRVIAQMLGSCVVGCKKIQDGIRHLLRHRDRELRAERWTDVNCVVIEVLLAGCHGPSPGDQPSNGDASKGLRVNDIAKRAEVLLKGRAAPAKLEPRAVGSLLDRLGLYRKRDARGFRVLLTPKIRRRIHQLASDHQVEAIRDRGLRCDLCKEILDGAQVE